MQMHMSKLPDSLGSQLDVKWKNINWTDQYQLNNPYFL